VADDHDLDLLVVGSGPAGLAAGVAAGRRGLSTVLFEADSVGGELVNRHTIENLPGRPESTGPELRSTLVDQLGAVGGQVRLAAVEGIERLDGAAADRADGTPDAGEGAGTPGFAADTTEGSYRARTVLIATGGRPVRLNVPGAEAYDGRGIFYCATCDGPLYAGETVAVAGGDDWALTDACYLTDHADRVLVLTEQSRLPAGETLRERVADHSAIEVRTDTSIRAVGGDEVLEHLELVDDDGEYEEAVGGLYVQQGVEPAADFLPEWVPRTDCGAVAVDEALETAVPGLFAAGDVRESSPRSVAAAIGDGVTACRSATRYLERPPEG
jgi:thioredoxin reductase (NADPH)